MTIFGPRIVEVEGVRVELPPPGLTLVEQAIFLLTVGLIKSLQNNGKTIIAKRSGSGLQLRGWLDNTADEPGQDVEQR